MPELLQSVLISIKKGSFIGEHVTAVIIPIVLIWYLPNALLKPISQMKKLTLIILLIMVSIGLFAQKKTYRIGVLVDNSTEEIEPIRKNLEREIQAVVGEDAIMSFPTNSYLINNYNLESARNNYNQLLNDENVDIILAFGVVNNLIIKNQESYSKPTFLFGAVNIDLVNVDLTKQTSGIENFTYLIQTVSFIEDLQKFQELTNFSNVGIVIEQKVTEILSLKETFDSQFANLEASYTLIPYNTLSDITSNLEDVDAVYLAGGFFLKSEEVKQLAKVFIDKKLPSFTSTSKKDVVDGLFATNQEDEQLDQLLRRIALSIEAYVSGEKLSELPVFIESNPRLTINYNTAEKIDVPIKYSLINSTDFVGDFKNAISKKQYNLLTAIDQVLEENLSLASQEKDVSLSEQDVKTANSNYLPNLSTSASATYVDPDAAANSFGQNPEYSTSGNVTLQQTIFSEAANANITIQKELLKAQQENLNTTQLDLIFDISNAYFTTLILKANAQIQLRNLDLTKRNLQIAEQNFEAGQAGKSDVLRFQSQMAQNTQSLVEAVNQLEQGFVLLNQLLNNPIETEIDVEDIEMNKGIFKEYSYNEITELIDNPKLREIFIRFLVEEAKKNAPELKVLDYNIGATERSEKLYGSGRFLPTVALQAQYNRTFNRSGAGSTAFAGNTLLDDNYNVALNVSIPIFNQNQNNINKQNAIIQKDQLNINKENFELGISANVRNNVLNVINQLSNIELSGVSEEAAKEALDLTQTSYSSGSVNIITLLDAQTNYLNAQLAKTNAIYNFLINTLQLERTLGYYFLLNTEDQNNQFRQRFLEYQTNKN